MNRKASTKILIIMEFNESRYYFFLNFIRRNLFQKVTAVYILTEWNHSEISTNRFIDFVVLRFIPAQTAVKVVGGRYLKFKPEP